METIAAADVRGWSQLNFARYGLADDDKLQVFVDRAAGYVFVITGQTYASITDGNLTTIAQQAIQMRTEQAVLQGTRGHLISAADSSVVSSFTAGSYSEQRRDPSRRGEERSINLWPALEDQLWLLMTPERWEWWWGFVNNTSIPAFTMEHHSWRSLGTELTFFEPWDTWVPAGFDSVGM